MIKLITICTCSLSSQYGSGSAYLCCEDKEIDQGSSSIGANRRQQMVAPGY